MPKVLRIILALGFGLLIAGGPLAAARAAEHDPEAVHREHPLVPTTPHELKEFAAGPFIWTIVIFVIMLAILYKTAWKQILAGLKAREDRIRKDIADAEAAGAKAQETLKQYQAQLATAEEKVREMIASASADAEKLAAGLRMKAQQESEEIKDRATKEIDAARKQALVDIYAQAAELSTSIAGKILRREIKPEDQQDLVRRSLDELQSVGSR